MAMQHPTSAEVIRAVQIVQAMGYGQVTVTVKGGQIDQVNMMMSIKQPGELDRIRYPRISAHPNGGTA